MTINLMPESDRPYLKPPASPPQVQRTARPIGVVIVTYKSDDLLERCLAKIAVHMPELPVYIYENSGADYPGREELAARHPDIHWVIGPVNLGFAAALNALVEHTPSDMDLLVLNPDARLLGPLTETRKLLQQSDVAAVAPLTLDETGPGPAIWDVATRRFTLVRALVGSAGYADRLRGTPLSFLHSRQPAEDQNIEGWLGSGVEAINRDAWNSIGGYDEEFFLFGEEADWQMRARQAGWRILLANELGVEHGGDDGGHGPAVESTERGRNHQLLRAHTALQLEHQFSAHHANAYLAGTSVLDRVQRNKRRLRGRALQRSEKPHVLITTDRLVHSDAARQKIELATELDRRGYPVTVVCLQRLGRLVRELPHSVQVVRQPWWAPMVDGPIGAAVVISGEAASEKRFAALWRALGRDRHWLLNGEERAYSGSRRTRRADGVVVPAEQFEPAAYEAAIEDVTSPADKRR